MMNEKREMLWQNGISTDKAVIKSIEVKKNDNGRVAAVYINFGPHYFVEIEEENGKLMFSLGATHHGFKADASQVGTGLEVIIDEAIEKHPGLVFG
jgi:hypothetical protein